MLLKDIRHNWDERALLFLQKKYASNINLQFCIELEKDNLMSKNQAASLYGQESIDVLYRKLIGSIMYVAAGARSYTACAIKLLQNLVYVDRIESEYNERTNAMCLIKFAHLNVL